MTPICPYMGIRKTLISQPLKGFLIWFCYTPIILDVEHDYRHIRNVSSIDFAVQGILELQAIFTIELQVILKTAWGNPKNQNFSKIIFLLIIYIYGDVQKTLQDDQKKKVKSRSV